MNQEPAMIAGFVGAILSILVSFGIPITPDQKLAIIGLAGPVVILIGAFIVRMKSTPNASVVPLVVAGLNAPAPASPAAATAQAEAMVKNG